MVIDNISEVQEESGAGIDKFKTVETMYESCTVSPCIVPFRVGFSLLTSVVQLCETGWFGAR